MKKKLASTSLFIFVMVIQTYAQQGLHAGLVFQPSLVTMRPSLFSSSNDYDPDYNQTIRSSIGAYLDYHFSPLVGVGVNILYSMQGQKFFANTQLDTIGTYYKYSSHFYKFNYIKIPVFLSYNSGGKKARLIGTVGPQLLILTSANDKYSGTTAGSKTDHDIIESYAPLNLGFNFGLGIAFFLANNAMLTIAPNFDIAFLNYNYTDDFAEPSYIGKSPISTTLGIQFGIKYVKNEVVPDDEITKGY